MIQPRILRDRVKSYLLGQLQSGNLSIGKTINLAAVARETGISVTPVREALSQLEHARIVKAIPNRGFVILPLKTSEAKHLYETVAQLEVMALESTKFSQEYIQELRRYFNQMETKNSVEGRFEFHKLLVHNCSNPILSEILTDLKARLFFYEQLLPESSLVDSQMEIQNEAILDALAENNIPTAALILKMHWMTILERVQNQLSKD